MRRPRFHIKTLTVAVAVLAPVLGLFGLWLEAPDKSWGAWAAMFGLLTLIACVLLFLAIALLLPLLLLLGLLIRLLPSLPSCRFRIRTLMVVVAVLAPLLAAIGRIARLPNESDIVFFSFVLYMALFPLFLLAWRLISVRRMYHRDDPSPSATPAEPRSLR